jgi:arginyl-tRNA synthetase
LEKAGIEAPTAARFDLLTQEAEAVLIKEIAKLELVVEDATKSLSPKALARYSYGLATTFSLFYEKVPVIKEPDKEVLLARLALVKAFGIALKNALSLLGVTALAKM